MDANILFLPSESSVTFGLCNKYALSLQRSNKYYKMTFLLINKIQSDLKHTPVQRAWLFGSYARNEETPFSDIDILVQFIPNAKISLFDYGGIVYQLEESTGCKVDLVQEGMIKSFARENVEKDKILIYERETS